MFLFSRRREKEEAAGALSARMEQLQRRVQELEASRSQIEGILQSMAEGVLVFEPGERLLLVNNSARTILGISPDVAVRDPLVEVMRYPDLQEVVREVLKTGRPQTRDLELYSPVDRILQVRATTCEVPGSGRCALLVIHDITEIRRLERVRSEFVANVSHELKTPLTGIRGAVETLLEGALEKPSDAREFVKAVKEETARLNHLVEDLLTLASVESKQTAPCREEIRISEFLQGQVVRYQSAAKAHKVALSLEMEPVSGTLLADPEQLAQAVGNLLDNAVKYNRPGGSVVLRAGESGGKLSIRVEDTGIGIPPEDQPRLFERFYRVDKGRARESGGTGLGLSIVKHVAEAHGGSVSVESRPGEGSCFTLLIPLR